MQHNIIAIIPIIPIMGILSRAAGGGFFKAKYDWQDRVPEILFSIPFGFAGGHFLWAVSSFFAFETGHGTVMHMGENPNQGDRRQFIDRFIYWLPIKKFEKLYCWIFMGIKGLWIGLPCGLYGLSLAVLWPLSYEIAVRFKKNEIAEWLTGIFAGIVCALSLW